MQSKWRRKLIIYFDVSEYLIYDNDGVGALYQSPDRSLRLFRRTPWHFRRYFLSRPFYRERVFISPARRQCRRLSLKMDIMIISAGISAMARRFRRVLVWSRARLNRTDSKLSWCHYQQRFWRLLLSRSWHYMAGLSNVKCFCMLIVFDEAVNINHNHIWL